MPHVSSGGGGDDLGSTDEVKVFKEEGDEENRSSENLTEDKTSLIDLTESEVRSILSFNLTSVNITYYAAGLFLSPPPNENIWPIAGLITSVSNR